MKKVLLLLGLCIFTVHTLFAQANAKIDSLKLILEKAKEDTNKVNVLNTLSKELWQKGVYDQAKKYADEAFDLSNSISVGKGPGWPKGKADAYHNIGIIYWYQSNFPEALKNHFAALKIREEIGDKRGMASSYNNIGIVYDEEGNYNEAMKNHMASVKIKQEIGDKPGLASSYINIGIIYKLQGNYPEALKYYSAALKIDMELKDSGSIAIDNFSMGNIYKAQGNYSESLKNHLAALKVFEKMGDKEGMSSSYSTIGNLYVEKGNYPEALKNYFSALKICEEIGNKQGIAASYLRIGGIYSYQSNDSEALKNYFSALKINEEIGSKRGIATSYEAIGEAYEKQGHYSDAREYFFSSLKIREALGDKSGISDSYITIGNVYYEMENYPDALQNYSAALKIKEEIGEDQAIAGCCNNIGNIYNKERKFVDALQYLNRGLSIAKEINTKGVVKDIYSGLAIASAGMSNYKKSYEYQQLYSDIKDTLLNDENNKHIAQMKEQYESDKKDQQIALLNKDKEMQAQEAKQQRIVRNIIIGAASGIIILLSLVFYQAYRRRKTKLSLEINQLNNKVLRTQLNPHFIFNALNSIRNYILLHAELADSYLTKFSTLMRQVLENSAEEKISLKEEIAMLENYMELEKLRLPYGFNYEVSIADNIDVANTMVPPMILQPMVENAIWHGLKPLNRRGKITLRFIESNGLLEAAVVDDGIGLRSATIETTSSEKKRSMGMQITRERIDLLNRKAKVKGWLNQKIFEQGSQVEISIPV